MAKKPNAYLERQDAVKQKYLDEKYQMRRKIYDNL